MIAEKVDVSKEVEDLVFDFFSEECDEDRDNLTMDTNIIEDLEGDSLMFLELFEIINEKYDLNVELKAVGKYIMKNPAETIGKVIELTSLIIKHGNKIAEL